MKQFNKKAALAGDIVITRSGKDVTQLCEFECKGGNEFAGVIDGTLFVWKKGGLFLATGIESSYDLFMAPKEITKWINIYRDQSCRFIAGIHDTESLALNCQHGDFYITTVPITFEI